MNSRRGIAWLVTICMVVMGGNALLGQDDPDIDVTPLSFSEEIPYGSSLTKPLTVAYSADNDHSIR